MQAVRRRGVKCGSAPCGTRPGKIGYPQADGRFVVIVWQTLGGVHASGTEEGPEGTPEDGKPEGSEASQREHTLLLADLTLTLTLTCTVLGPNGWHSAYETAHVLDTPGYDVFISHRGKDKPTGTDTKRGFVSFLHDRLQMASVTAFVDEHELQSGDRDAEATMQSCLRSSSIAVPVLHASYGNSEWCLRELAIMVSTPGLVVMPVFLDDEGPAVLKQLKAGAARLQKAGKASREDVDTWIAAINTVGKITGWRLDQMSG